METEHDRSYLKETGRTALTDKIRIQKGSAAEIRSSLKIRKADIAAAEKALLEVASGAAKSLGAAAPKPSGKKAKTRVAGQKQSP